MNDALIVTLSSLFNVLLGGFVILRNPKSPINRTFAAFAGSLVIWTVFNFLADQAPDHNLIFTRLTFFSGVFIGLSLYSLSNIFPNDKAINSRRTTALQYILCVATCAVSLTPLLVPEVRKIEGGGVELMVGPLYYFYIAYILQVLIVIILNFKNHFRKSNPVEKTQIKFLLLGVVLYAFFAIGSNLVLPLVADNWSSSRYGPIFTLLFVAFSSYAIVKHRLMDIRLIIVRALAYALLMGTLAGLYALSVFVIAGRFIDESTFSQRTLPIVSAILLVFTAPYLKSLFNRLTSSLFYRDSYDPQVFLGQLNKILVSSVNLEKLLQESAEVIGGNLKAEYCVFTVNKTSYEGQRVIGPNLSRHYSKSDEVITKEIVPLLTEKITLADDLSEENVRLRGLFRKNNISVLVKLSADPGKGSQELGYMLIGSRKDGRIYSDQDVALLSIVCDELVIAVQNALRFEEIERFATTLQAKVDDATKELRKTNEKLKALDEAKDEFISMASHQLRTPLTSVKGYISMVLDGDTGKLNKPQKDLLGQAFSSSQRMVYLISDLLNVSRLKTGKFLIENAPTYLPDVIAEELMLVAEMAKVKNVTVEYEKPKEFPTLSLDETKIRQVIMNFVDNAIHYTPNGGVVKVLLQHSAHAMVFSVTDDGIGVPKSEQHHLFTKFYRAGNARKARPDGTGLGLFMAKKVIVASGGAIIFKSQENKGSTFGFTFPLSKIASKED